MEPLTPIRLDKLQDYKQKLLQISELDEFTIRDIWRLDDETCLSDFRDMKYHWNIPLYQKMIFRFWQADHMASKFYRGLDPGNQNMLLNHFNVSWKEFHQIIEFFAWISNGLAIFEINKMDCNGAKDYKSSEYVQKWRKNDVVFFFWIPENQQKDLIKRYNKECVDRFNDMIKRDNDDDIYYYT